MKIIFDNEIQKENLMDCLAENLCPSDVNMEDSAACLHTDCRECWEAKIETEVNDESKSD